jgi:hypothetical protein
LQNKFYFSSGIERISRFGFFRRALSIFVTETMKHGVMVSFLAWLLGTVVVLIMGPLLGAAAAGLFLGNPFSLGAFCLGMVIGLFTGYKANKKAKMARAALRKKLENSQEKLDELQLLEAKNNALKALILAQGVKPLPVVEPHDDRAFRRFSKKKRWRSALKSIASAGFLFIDKVGGGIFIMRASIFLIMGIAGAGSAIIFGLPGLGIAIGAGVLWAAYNFYKHQYQKKLELAERTLNDLPNRISAAKNQHEIYLKQLKQAETLSKEDKVEKTDKKRSVIELDSVSFAPKLGLSSSRSRLRSNSVSSDDVRDRDSSSLRSRTSSSGLFRKKQKKARGTTNPFDKYNALNGGGAVRKKPSSFN